MKKTVKTLNKGMKSLQKGGKSLNKATGKLVNGVIKLDNASGKLAKGADKLAEGTKKFNDKGIKKLSDTYNDDIKTAIDRFKEVVNVGKEYKSFSGINNKMDGEVKFIIETEAVKNE